VSGLVGSPAARTVDAHLARRSARGERPVDSTSLANRYRTLVGKIHVPTGDTSAAPRPETHGAAAASAASSERVTGALDGSQMAAFDDREVRRGHADALVQAGDPMGSVMAMADAAEDLDADEPRRWELEAEAAARYADMPMLPVRAAGVTLDVVGGLVRRAHGSTASLSAALPLLLDQPIRALGITKVDSTTSLVDSPLLERIERLDLRWVDKSIPPLLHSPRWTRLRHLSVMLDRDRAMELTEHSVMQRLSSLRVAATDPRAMRALLDSGRLRGSELRHFEEADRLFVPDHHAEASFQHLPLPGLRSLSVRRLDDAALLQKMESLEHFRCERGVSEAFFATALPPRLRSLDVSTNAAGILALSQQRHLRLHHLQLRRRIGQYSEGGGPGLPALVRSPLLDECTSLSIAGFSCADVLKELPRTIRRLCVDGRDVSPFHARVFKTVWPGANRLISLELAVSVDGEALAELLDAAAFPSLRRLSIDASPEAIQTLARARMAITHLDVGCLSPETTEALLTQELPHLRVVEATELPTSNHDVDKLRARYAVFAPERKHVSAPSRAGTFEWRAPAKYAPFEWSLVACEEYG